ncbi:MAG: amidohydrolase [Bacteroidota bacterium]
MNSLRITTVQSILHWEDITRNLSMFDEKLKGLAGQTDLIILPEMFTTGFSMNAAALAEGMDGKTIQWLTVQAKEANAAVTGSFIVKEGGRFYNRLVWMYPDGRFVCYDKRHLFTLAGEHKTYEAGTRKSIVEWKGWKVCPLVCYDLRFPVWSRNAEGYDLLLYVANWPNARSHHWKHLLIARAIENQAFVAGVNRTGSDEKGLDYSGDSAVVDYAGKVIYQITDQEDIFTCTLDRAQMTAFRERLNFLNDQDNFQILNE